MRRNVMILIVIMMVGGWLGAEDVRWVPVAASNPGEFGSQWLTDLWIYSLVLDSPIEVHLAFYPDTEGTANPTEITVTVPGNRVVAISDVVGSLFGESRPGALRLRSEYPFAARSRTYNDGSEVGTFGQGIPARAADDLYLGSVLVGAANIPGESGVRSNLGFMNPNDQSGRVMIFVTDQETGDFLGMTNVDIGAYGWFQDDVFDLVGASSREVHNAAIHVVFDPGLLAYLSRIDNTSGDGTYIEGINEQTTRLLQTDWEVVPTLTFSEGVTIDTLVYTGEDGNGVTVTNPASGWTQTLNFTSPAEFCYSAEGSAGDAGGEVLMEVVRTPADGTPYTGRALMRISGADEIWVDDCFDLF